MEEYVALRDCYFDGHYLKKGQTIKVAKGRVIEFALLRKMTEDETPEPKKVVSKK